MIKKISEANRGKIYFDDILERGAFDFQYKGIVQDFEKEFAPYIKATQDKKIPSTSEGFLIFANEFGDKKSVGISDVRQEGFHFDKLKVFVSCQEFFYNVLILAPRDCASAVN